MPISAVACAEKKKQSGHKTDETTGIMTETLGLNSYSNPTGLLAKKKLQYATATGRPAGLLVPHSARYLACMHRLIL